MKPQKGATYIGESRRLLHGTPPTRDASRPVPKMAAVENYVQRTPNTVPLRTFWIHPHAGSCQPRSLIADVGAALNEVVDRVEDVHLHLNALRVQGLNINMLPQNLHYSYMYQTTKGVISWVYGPLGTAQ